MRASTADKTLVEPATEAPARLVYCILIILKFVIQSKHHVPHAGQPLFDYMVLHFSLIFFSSEFRVNFVDHGFVPALVRIKQGLSDYLYVTTPAIGFCNFCCFLRKI